MNQTSTPLPAPLLYSVLKALKPPADGVRFKAPDGGKPDASGKRALQEALDAARQARSAGQFAKLVGGQELAVSHGNILCLTVEYNKDGYTIVRVRYQDGTQIISSFPTT
jgi:hypothetical protein